MAEAHPIPKDPRFQDITGKTHGRLTVVSYAGRIGRRHQWNCLCECGTETVVKTSDLNTGNTRSCGCLHRDTMTKHRMASHPLYFTWYGMVARCHEARTMSDMEAAEYKFAKGGGSRWRRSPVIWARSHPLATRSTE